MSIIKAAGWGSVRRWDGTRYLFARTITDSEVSVQAIAVAAAVLLAAHTLERLVLWFGSVGLGMSLLMTTQGLVIDGCESTYLATKLSRCRRRHRYNITNSQSIRSDGKGRRSGNKSGT